MGNCVKLPKIDHKEPDPDKDLPSRSTSTHDGDLSPGGRSALFSSLATGREEGFDHDADEIGSDDEFPSLDHLEQQDVIPSEYPLREVHDPVVEAL